MSRHGPTSYFVDALGLVAKVPAAAKRKDPFGGVLAMPQNHIRVAGHDGSPKRHFVEDAREVGPPLRLRGFVSARNHAMGRQRRCREAAPRAASHPALRARTPSAQLLPTALRHAPWRECCLSDVRRLQRTTRRAYRGSNCGAIRVGRVARARRAKRLFNAGVRAAATNRSGWGRRRGASPRDQATSWPRREERGPPLPGLMRRDRRRVSSVGPTL
jgi:hypothetical protein